MSVNAVGQLMFRLRNATRPAQCIVVRVLWILGADAFDSELWTVPFSSCANHDSSSWLGSPTMAHPGTWSSGRRVLVFRIPKALLGCVLPPRRCSFALCLSLECDSPWRTPDSCGHRFDSRCGSAVWGDLWQRVARTDFAHGSLLFVLSLKMRSRQCALVPRHRQTLS